MMYIKFEADFISHGLIDLFICQARATGSRTRAYPAKLARPNTAMDELTEQKMIRPRYAWKG